MLPGFINRFTRSYTDVTQPLRTVMSLPETTEKATIAAGCFWGVEHLFRKVFADNGLLDARVGYVGGDTQSPSYRAVCTGGTGHAEAVQVLYDPDKLSYQALLEFFFKMHDPTTKNQQGGDVGTQYRSAIFTHGPDQERVAKGVFENVQTEWWKKPLFTEIVPAGHWWDAEEYHQLYLDKNPGGYNCPAQSVALTEEV